MFMVAIVYCILWSPLKIGCPKISHLPIWGTQFLNPGPPIELPTQNPIPPLLLLLLLLQILLLFPFLLLLLLLWQSLEAAQVKPSSNSTQRINFINYLHLIDTIRWLAAESVGRQSRVAEGGSVFERPQCGPITRPPAAWMPDEILLVIICGHNGRRPVWSPHIVSREPFDTGWIDTMLKLLVRHVWVI